MVVLDFSVRLGLKRWNLGSLGFNFISEALGSFWLVLCGSFKIECNTVATFVWKRLNESVVQSILATKLKALFDVYFCQSLRQDAPQTLCGTLRWRCPFLQCWRGYSDPRKAPKPRREGFQHSIGMKAMKIPMPFVAWHHWHHLAGSTCREGPGHPRGSSSRSGPMRWGEHGIASHGLLE